MSSPQTRRRQRAPRLIAAAALVITAAVVVIGAVLSASVTLVSVAAVLAVVLAALAVQITYQELVVARREAAADRARQAKGYRTLAEQRSEEQREFVAAMESRLGRADEAVTQLESAVVASQSRAADSLRRADLAETECARLSVVLDESEERAAVAIVRVAELEGENDGLRVENDTLRVENDGLRSENVGLKSELETRRAS